MIPGDVSDTTTVVRETSVRVRVWENEDGARGATVIVRCLPGYSWWTCPDARTLRRLVSRELRGTGWKRKGTRRDGLFSPAGWVYHYSLERHVR